MKDYSCCSSIYVPYSSFNTGMTDKAVNMHLKLKITQSMGISMIDGYRMHLTCAVSLSNDDLTPYIDMTWSGLGLLQSLWVQQSNVKKYNAYIERKLLFEPWLDLHAGEYTCNLAVKDIDNMNNTFVVNRPFVVSGKL